VLGQLVDGVRVSAAIESLARWWTQAPQEERFRLWRAAIEGEKGAPQLDQLRLASFLAEAQAGEIAEG